MFKTLKNAFGLPDLRKKIFYTLFILLIFRIGSQIYVPYVSSGVDEAIRTYAQGSIFEYLNLLSGSAFSQATLFALSVSPYITASIVIQLLTIAIPALERLSKQGPEGQKKITQITRGVTAILALVTAFGYYIMLKSQDMLINDGVFAAIVIIACYSAGAALIMWLAEKINENGIGNGISLILLINILSSGPSIVTAMINAFKNGPVKAIIAVVALIIGIGMIMFIVFMTNSERKIPIQYAKRVVGRKMYGGQNSNLPIKLNMTGVMPIIFAQSIVSLPATIGMFVNAKEGTFWHGFFNFFSPTNWFYSVIYLILIVAFAYFYIAISFNPVEVANNLQSNGGVVPGIRQGRPTAEYITKILNRITFIGALFLGVIAVLPLIASMIDPSLSALAFGGSSIIIVVGVILETVREIEAQTTMRHYKGFLE